MSSPATAPPAPNNLKRIVAASLIGTTIEWYDFFLYGSAAALVFNELFFPDSDPLVGTLLSFLTYAVGFAARPVGALVFGHYGDRLGRKGAYAASDAFFPFPDGLEILTGAGVKAVVQPGGSVRDELVVEAAKKAGVTMYFTGTRHFFH